MWKLNVISAIVLFATHLEATLPPIIQTCPRNSPDPSKCIREVVEKIRPNLANGDFGANFNVPKLEPLFIDKISMDRGPDFKAEFTDIVVSGPSKFVLEDFKDVDFQKLTFDFIILLPRLDFTAKYNLKARLAIIDLKGKGNVKGYFKNSRGRVRIRGYLDPKDGKNYFRLKRLQVRISIGEAKFNLENLFGGDPNLGRIGNQVVNENSEIFLAELIPGLEQSLAAKFQGIANEILKDATYDEMFPEAS